MTNGRAVDEASMTIGGDAVTPSGVEVELSLCFITICTQLLAIDPQSCRRQEECSRRQYQCRTSHHLAWWFVLGS